MVVVWICSPSGPSVKGWVTLTFDSSPIKETFAKLSGTAIVCSDYQSAKLGFLIDSHLRGNDGRLCKGLIKGEGDAVGCVALIVCPTLWILP